MDNEKLDELGEVPKKKPTIEEQIAFLEQWARDSNERIHIIKRDFPELKKVEE